MSKVDAAAIKLAKCLLSAQRKICDRANNVLLRISPRRLKTGLIFFVIASMGLSICITVDALLHTDRKVLQLQPIRPLPTITIDDAHLYSRDDEVKLQQFIRRYEQVMDSMRNADSIKIIQHEK